MDVVAVFPADAQTAEPVQQCERGLGDPAVHAQAGTVFGAASGDVRGDAQLADLATVLVVVVAAVGVYDVGTPTWSSALAADRRDGLEQRDQLGDVVAVPTGQRHGQWDAVRFDNHVVPNRSPVRQILRRRLRRNRSRSSRLWWGIRCRSF
ncbi:MAG: hypothetical protein AUG49_09075 [Catenulispora sp. 13_1_20CM_3_70_7]|nr:MAG: hypothetical protein AUG49_09075 [Catenulispora sp. 13_1_20CM_3_70_7]